MKPQPKRIVLYNGASGGLGRHMATALANAGLASVRLHSRLSDRAGRESELAAIGPVEAAIFIHLAARVSVPACEEDPDGAFDVNVVQATAALESVIGWAATRRVSLSVIYVSTGHVYAAPQTMTRLGEDAGTAPRSVYARTKLAAELVFQQRSATDGVPLIIARVFGLLAPGQPAHYVLPGLISRARENRFDEIPGLDVTRDYLDARDVCRNLVALGTAGGITDGTTHIVNVCSGEPTTIRELLAAVLVAYGARNPNQLAAAARPGPSRPDDVPWLVGDPTLFARWTGLDPRSITLEVTARDAIAAAAL